METRELLNKIKENLDTQFKLKKEYEQAGANKVALEKKLAETKTKLLNAEQTYDVFKKDLKEKTVYETTEYTGQLKPVCKVMDNSIIQYGLGVDFMGKSYKLLKEDEYLQAVNSGTMQFEYMLKIVDGVFEKYLQKGDVIFDENSLREINDFINLYSTDTQVVTKKLEDTVAKNQLKKWKAGLNEYQDMCTNLRAEIELTEQKLDECKEFKSPLINKLFSKKTKWEEHRNELLNIYEAGQAKIAELTEKINDKADLAEWAKETVDNEITNLICIVDWIEGLSSVKSKLQNMKYNNITKVREEVEDLEYQLTTEQTHYDELKGFLQLHKKIANEAVANALKSKKFVEEFNQLDADELPKSYSHAYKFINTRYNDHIRNSVDKIVKN